MFAAAQDGILDLRLNWRQAASFLKPEAPINLDFIRTWGIPVVNDDLTVVINPARSELPELREWLDEYVSKTNYTLFGRFSWVTYNVKVVRRIDGLRFSFANPSDCVPFKLRWYTR